MQEFRRFVRGPVGKVLLAAIILPFVISGFYGYFTGGGSDSTVAEVEGNKITRAYVNSRTQQLRQMLRQQSPNINESMLDSFIRPQMVLQGIVNEQLMISAAYNADMAYSDTQAAREIRDNPAFADNGAFSETRFEQLVRAQGMTPQGYLEGIRQERVSQQYRAAFAATDFALANELTERRRLGEQRRDIRYVRLGLDRLRSNVSVSDQEVDAFYKEHQGEFMRPEQLRVRYLELTPDHYRDRIDITDEQVAAEYQARKQMRENASSRRQVAHVLIAVNDDREEEAALARAREARQALESGEDFAKIAAEYSDDAATASNGGELGTVEPGDLPESLDKALEKLSVGDVSEPVVSDAGVHLLKLESEQKVEMPPLAEMRDQIVSDLSRAQAESMLSEDLVTLEELIYEHANLEVPAEQLNLPLETTDWVTLQNLPAPLNNDQVRQALNSDAVREQGHNSDLLDLGGDRFVAVRLQDTQAAEPLPLDQVRNDIVAQLRLRKARDEAAKLADQARAAVEDDGADLNQVAEMLSSAVEEESGLQRGAAEPDMAVSDAAFATPRPADGETSGIRFVDLRNGDLVAFQVTGVQDGALEALPDEQKRQALQELSRVEGERTFRQVMTFLRDSLDVELHPNRLADGESQPAGQP